ncbi:hypothetical protein HED55_25050 [Ochrobactrum haematophilum]|uniref:Transporter n=1 Tax=Brucella haematophila TaxID=419474 RepID=A0ABX1DWV2_9HYPH|nr:hypothetical protein [Brucella haematophila]
MNQTELQPFIAWHIGKGRTISANLDADYDWTADQWTVPVSGSFSQIVKVGDQTMSLSLGAKYWLEGPEAGPKWGIKAGVTFLFPKPSNSSAEGRASIRQKSTGMPVSKMIGD